MIATWRGNIRQDHITQNTTKPIIKNKPNKKIIDQLKPSSIIQEQRSNYDPLIPRKIVEAICGFSDTTLMKLETEEIITPIKIKSGRQQLVTYTIEDVQAIFKYKKISFKTKQEAEVISVFSQKGGVGKSSCTQHIGSMLSLVGKVLIVDLDAQSDSTQLFGCEADYGDSLVNEDELSPNIINLMDWEEESGKNEVEMLNPKDVIKTISPFIDVLPADLDLGEINYDLNRAPLKYRENPKVKGQMLPAVFFMVKEVLDKVKNDYDYILIDCPPNIESCNVSALYASNRIIIPLELEAKSITTIRRNIRFLERLVDLDIGFEWDKVLIVPNKFRRENIKIKALTTLMDDYKDSDFATLSEVVLPNSTIIDKCSDWQKPIYSVTSKLGTTSKGAFAPAKEFTNYFWGIMHEILDLDLERLIFEPKDGEGSSL